MAVGKTMREWVSRVVFADEFRVDEKPEPVFESALSLRASEEAGDLLTTISEMMLAREGMAEMSEQLKACQSEAGGQEFDRFIRRILPRLDGFDRILEGLRSMPPTPEVNNWLQTLEGLYFKLQGDLVSVGLVPMETVGKLVNLECMEVIDYRPTNDYPHNMVIQEVKRGWRYKGKPLRDAKVVVACNERG
ncbi:MAG: nucleotide exchange factor GrpE [Candidatus Sumerlaeota bacterium]|nr:nucleotide exchange factor GrpE [Candidatus Sumerlaeota bacterium]